LAWGVLYYLPVGFLLRNAVVAEAAIAGATVAVEAVEASETKADKI
tara:strand:- start:1328 stop:1465 length:138 start_codon:yes stop_codon:yes gene_type:complete